MAFNLRDFDDQKKARMGLVECVKYKLIDPYQVLYEKNGMAVFQTGFDWLVSVLSLYTNFAYYVC